MRRASIFIILFAGIIFGSACNKQKQEADAATGVPGDNLDLYAVLDVFKSSSNLEAFEKALNDKSNKINNLDLNTDGKVDYIKVIDNKDGDAHAITLRALVSKTESHDVAVIEIEKTGENTANIQIIGDEAIYGKDVIIEPKSEKEKAGFVVTTVGVNVYSWPVVTYMYSPAYVVYASPYEYDYYPVWYDPWVPVAYDAYYPTVYHYHSYYYPVTELRFERAHAIYHERRVVSGYVQKHHYDNGNHNGWNKGNGNNIAPRGNDNGGNRGHQDNYAPRGNGAPNVNPHGNGNANPKGGPIDRSNQRGNGSVNPKGGDYNKSNQRGSQNSPNVNPRGNQNSPSMNQRGGNSNPKGGYDHSNQRSRQQSAPNVNPRGNQSSPSASPRGNANPKGGGYQQGSPAPRGNAAPRSQPQQGGNNGPKGNPRPR